MSNMRMKLRPHGSVPPFPSASGSRLRTGTRR
ncbi:hypothetical protein SCANM63S_00617 [Streptomyces canarius]